jgi:hypothetical protein
MGLVDRVDFGAVLFGEAHIGEHVLLHVIHHGGELGRFERSWSGTGGH